MQDRAVGDRWPRAGAHRLRPARRRRTAGRRARSRSSAIREPMRAEAKYSRLRLRPGAADERACGMRRCYVFAAEAELAEHFGLMLALNGRRPERVEAFVRKFPGAAGQAEGAAAAGSAEGR